MKITTDLFNKHLEAIENNPIQKQIAAYNSVEITLGYMKEFKNWCDENEEDIRKENMSTQLPAIITDKLIALFLTSKK